MIKLIIKKYVKNYEEVQDKDVRESYGVLSGILGIISNLFLFGLKLSIGIIMNSIAIISDAFNNLSDIGTSIIAIFGVKMSNALPDDEHPFGHGRIEYISSLIVSFIIILVGIELFKGSIHKIINPEKVIFNLNLMLILTSSILVKIWMFSYNNYIGNIIDSRINKATAVDSLNDVVATFAVIISMFVQHFVDAPIDGFAGVLVSILIIYTGFNISKDTVNVLLGQCPSDETVDKIFNHIENNEYIIGVHDLRIHDYGPGRSIGSVHVEILDSLELVHAHSIIDKIEIEILNEMGIDLVIHIDPVCKAEKI